MGGLIVRSSMLVVAGAILGIGANAFTPHPAPLGKPVFAAAELPGATCSEGPGAVARISVEEAKPLCISCTAAFVDARSPGEYAAGHVTNALHVAPGESVAPVLGKLREKGTVIVYDRDRDCSAADQVAAQLRAQGLPDVRVLTGAWPEWLASGGPGESGACAACTLEKR
jgi:3-mercaptopyruvate sulfurtransferase SseA